MLIDYAKLIRIAKEFYGEEAAHNIDLMARDAEVVDAVPVVRCKDCKHWHSASEMGVPCCDMLVDFAIRTANDFCSYGQRKDGADNAAD